MIYKNIQITGVGLLATALTFAHSLNAQTAVENEAEEVYNLSPFTVESSEEVGYIATSTLAGTRLKRTWVIFPTPLR